MKRAWRLTEQQAFCLLDTQHFLTEEGVISRGTEHVQFPDAFWLHRKVTQLIVRATAYMAYITPSAQRDIYAISIQERIQADVKHIGDRAGLIQCC